MKQTGNALLVLLVLMTIMASISIDLLTTSLQEFKATTLYNQRLDAFYQTEYCIEQVSQGQLNENVSLKLDDLSQKPLDWWQKNGKPCGDKRWYVTQHLTAQDLLLSVYHEQHILLQAILKKNPGHHWRKVSWSQVY